jgi:hypothetical protein
LKDAGIAQLVEHNLAKVGVAGSNPVSRSIKCSEWWTVIVKSGSKGMREAIHDSLFTFLGSQSFFIGGVPKWLRERSAKPLCSGSNPLAASIPHSSVSP